MTLQPCAQPAWAGPAFFSTNWNVIGRTRIQTNADSLTIQGGFVADNKVWEDADVSFQAKAPEGTSEVQIWAGLRCQNRARRYVFALRGGNDNDVYLARYGEDGEAEFLGFAPLDFKPQPDTWYRLRAVTIGKRIQIYLNDEKLPRINVIDTNALWTIGGVCLGGGWLPVEFAGLKIKPLSDADKTAIAEVGGACWTPPVVDKEALRKSQRAAYMPATLDGFEAVRTKHSLDGNWLFMPDYGLAPGEKPETANDDDSAWHVMPVPEFWTPGLSWLHGETGFRNLAGVAKTKGVADKLYVEENRRCDSYTFDWRKTKAAWYRQHLVLPTTLKDKHFVLTFSAIAKVCDIWVNGIKVGSHTGLFSEVRCDATAALQPGDNVIAVHVLSDVNPSREPAGKIEGVAVTVEVTSQMLHSLPHGMLQDDVGGIWQPVTLEATSPVFVTNCFIETGLHSAKIDIDIQNSSERAAKVEVEFGITPDSASTILYEMPDPTPFPIVAGKTTHLHFTTSELAPKLWSPDEPNLYDLCIHILNGKELLDNYTVRFGFRTFSTNGSQLVLNGKPYWLRGGNPFPNTLRPNDRVLARQFTQLAHDGNVRVTRSHIVPFTSAWLDAADEIGMGVSYEGTWPWLMLRGDPPDTNLLAVWKEENLSLMRQYRNHPSILFWTVNNEMKFESADAGDLPLLKRKWTILDDMIKAMRATDPTRPIVADSSYVRREARKGFEAIVKPNHFDDGDIDDSHRYYGWYNESFFHLNDGHFGRDNETPGRPLISQEMATGYPNNDDGHPTRFYLFQHETPQALVGDDAYENADPAIFLQRQAFMTKELAEMFRRSCRNTMAGILHFAYFTWLKSPWARDEFTPWPAYDGLKIALQPILVSAELHGRHFFAGRHAECKVCVINDAENCSNLPPSKVVWAFTDGTNHLSDGSITVPAVRYYQNSWQDIDLNVPATLPAPCVNGRLEFRLEANGRILSTNSYDVVLATDWANNGAAQDDIVVVTNLSKVISDSAAARALRKSVEEGGRVLLLHPGAALVKFLPEIVTAYTQKKGEIVTMRIPESPVFSGIEPPDLAWFDQGKQLPFACTGVYQLARTNSATALAWQCDLHGYLQASSDIKKYSGSPLVEIRLGKGLLLASEMCYETKGSDPIEARLWRNMIDYLRSKHDN